MNANSNIIQYFPQQQGSNSPVAITRHENDRTFIDVPYIIDKTNDMYTWIYITLSKYNHNYRSLVDAIIALKYDISESFAILFNYLDNPENEVYKQEYNEFQAWREHAKNYAKDYFNAKKLE